MGGNEFWVFDNVSWNSPFFTIWSAFEFADWSVFEDDVLTASLTSYVELWWPHVSSLFLEINILIKETGLVWSVSGVVVNIWEIVLFIHKLDVIACACLWVFMVDTEGSIETWVPLEEDSINHGHKINLLRFEWLHSPFNVFVSHVLVWGGIFFWGVNSSWHWHKSNNETSLFHEMGDTSDDLEGSFGWHNPAHVLHSNTMRVSSIEVNTGS